MDDQLCLKWRSHNDAIADIAFRFLEHESLVDVTLACPENGQVHYFKAHQIILSACSPYFESLFLYNTHPHPVIFLKDVKKSELENILVFMYRGEVNVHYNRIKDVIDTAKSLMIRGLSEEVYDADAETSKRASNSSSSAEKCHPKKRKCVEVKVEEEKNNNEDFGNTYQECNSPAASYDNSARRNSNDSEQVDNPMDYSMDNNYRNNEGSSYAHYQLTKPYNEESNSDGYYGSSSSSTFSPRKSGYANPDVKPDAAANEPPNKDPNAGAQDVSVIQHQSNSNSTSNEVLSSVSFNFSAVPLPGPKRVGHFQLKWMELFSWLQYDKETKKMFCKFCRKWGDLIPNIRRTSFVDGSCNFRFEIVKHHDCSKSHQICMHKEEVNGTISEYY